MPSFTPVDLDLLAGLGKFGENARQPSFHLVDCQLQVTGQLWPNLASLSGHISQILDTVQPLPVVRHRTLSQGVREPVAVELVVQHRPGSLLTIDYVAEGEAAGKVATPGGREIVVLAAAGAPFGGNEQDRRVWRAGHSPGVVEQLNGTFAFTGHEAGPGERPEEVGVDVTHPIGVELRDQCGDVSTGSGMVAEEPDGRGADGLVADQPMLAAAN